MNLSISHLQNEYRTGRLTPTSLVNKIDELTHRNDDHCIWIRRLSLNEMLAYAQKLEALDPASLPLYGIPFAIKDNIDLAGIPTTAACPKFSFTPTESATVVQKLIDAGAIPIGKTNLDQFATGLVGARTPYGAGRNAFNSDYISGGSSAGSAVSVALGMASFSLGTDTAGSGRVPAAFNNLVGHKPTCGLLSTKGVLPACRTLDCVSIFALSAPDAAQVLSVAQGYDIQDAYSRHAPLSHENLGESFEFGVPQNDQLAFFGNAETPQLFEQAIQRLTVLGGKQVTIDFAPFLETARLLYEGPWVAERYAAIQSFIEKTPEALFPVTRQIIGGATRFNAVDVYNAQYKLKALQQVCAGIWDTIDVMLTPTAGTIYKIDDVNVNPVQTNSNLGYYTNFMNLLDLTAVAVPAGFQSNGLPFGVTIAAPAFSDGMLLNLGEKMQYELGIKGGLPTIGAQ
jgi:allophanate hydrolase